LRLYVKFFFDVIAGVMVLSEVVERLMVEYSLLLANLLVDRQQWIDDRAKLMIRCQELADLSSELRADCSSEEQPIFLDHAADLVLDVPANANQTRPSHENGADLLTLLALDLYLAIPTHPNQLSETLRIILIAFVDTNGEGSMGMTSIDADHGEIDASKLVPKPARHRAGLEADTLGMGCSLRSSSVKAPGSDLLFLPTRAPPHC
jgi:hypothetical protein